MFPTSQMGGRIFGNLHWRSLSSFILIFLVSLHESDNHLPIPLPDPWQQKALPWRPESLHTAASQDGMLLNVKLAMIWDCFSCGRYIAGMSHSLISRSMIHTEGQRGKPNSPVSTGKCMNSSRTGMDGESHVSCSTESWLKAVNHKSRIGRVIWTCSWNAQDFPTSWLKELGNYLAGLRSYWLPSTSANTSCSNSRTPTH